MKDWRLAESLETLRRQLNEKYPNRSKASDGTIGDTAHSKEKSEHNPNPAGVVTAFDITHDPVNGVHGGELAELLNNDPRCWYVIWNRKIWDIKWIPYNGRNPHDRHVHISVKQSVSDYDNPNKWNLEGGLTMEQYNQLLGFIKGLEKQNEYRAQEIRNLLSYIKANEKLDAAQQAKLAELSKNITPLNLEDLRIIKK